MKNRKTFRKRHRAITALFLPAALFIWILGWSLIWIGSSKKPKKNIPTTKKDNVTIMAIPLEEPIESRH